MGIRYYMSLIGIRLGAATVGIYPVWYENDADKGYKNCSCEYVSKCNIYISMNGAN